MNKVVFESLLKKPPDNEEKSYIFIVSNQTFAENIGISGFVPVLIRNADGYIKNIEELQEIISNMLFNGCVSDYIFIPCLSRNDNESLQEFFEDESLNFRDDGWVLSRKKFLRRQGAEKQTKKAIQAYINEYKIPAKGSELKVVPVSEDKILTEEEAVLLSKSNPLDLRENRFGNVTQDFINYTDIVEHDAYLKGKISYDLMEIRPMVKGMYWSLDAHPITDNDYANIRRYMSNVYGISNKSDCQQAVNLVARKNSFHPMRDFFDGLEWDGVSRVPDLFPKFLGAERCRYTTVFTELLLSSIIERIYVPGTKQDICYTLADKMQGSGKSTICRYLAVFDDRFTDELKDFKDAAKAFEKIKGKMVCELAEMLSIRRAKDVESVKAYLSQKSDDYRTPYNVCPERYLRQVTFLATTNKPEFLPQDPTGNRRFVVLHCDGKKAEMHPVEHEAAARKYIVDCYAEMMHRRKQQGKLSVVFPKDMMAEVEALQEMATPEDSRIGMIQNYLDNCKEDVVCSRSVWDSVFSDPDRPVIPKKIDLLDIADIMNLSIEGWEKYKGKHGDSKTGRYRFKDYGSQRAWQRIVSTESEGVDTKNAEGEHKTEESNGFIQFSDDEELPFL